MHYGKQEDHIMELLFNEDAEDNLIAEPDCSAKLLSPSSTIYSKHRPEYWHSEY
jgi:hypothetical protein